MGGLSSPKMKENFKPIVMLRVFPKQLRVSIDAWRWLHQSSFGDCRRWAKCIDANQPKESKR